MSTQYKRQMASRCRIVLYDKKDIFGFASHFWHRAPNKTLGGNSDKGYLVPDNVPLSATPEIMKRPARYINLGRQRGCRLLTAVLCGFLSGEWCGCPSLQRLASCQLCQQDLGATQTCGAQKQSTLATRVSYSVGIPCVGCMHLLAWGPLAVGVSLGGHCTGLLLLAGPWKQCGGGNSSRFSCSTKSPSVDTVNQKQLKVYTQKNPVTSLKSPGQALSQPFLDRSLMAPEGDGWFLQSATVEHGATVYPREASSLYELLTALPAQLQPHVDSQEDLTFLWDMFGEKSLHSLVKIHEKLHYYEKQNPVPILHGAAVLADDLAEELQNKPLNSESRELLKLLSKPNVKALLSVHDTVAQKNYDPVLPPMPDDIDEEEDSVKIIRLVKNREPLGATIKKDEQTGAIIVARIMRGGAADRSGLIHVGDELREVNGIPVEDKRPEEIIQILAQSQGAITFKIIPSIKEETPSKEGKMFIKALFDYDPNEDKAIPCKEAGLSFKKGDILQIMSQDDATWWQAKHAGDANPRAGLIPSKHFQERRLALRRPEILVQPLKVSNRKSSGFRRSFRLSRKDKKTNKSMYECKKSDQYDTADVPTYEEVTPYRRQTNEKYRLVVLVGPVGVGLNELKRKLLISDTQHYGVTVPHTTRARRSQESDGVEYIFISKHLFETDVQNNKFIEYGEYKNNYYGTSIDSVRSVLARNKVCLLDVQPHTVKHLRTLEFKPYVIFIKPPSIERLRETRKNAKIISSRDDQGAAKPFTEEDFQEMIKSAQIMENQYGHLFDKIIVNDDLTVAFNELKTTFDKLETEAHWVPVSWLHS
ncbi:PREDICTED: MAGUK p55 subfamily member 7 [Odobenus rosmarus divergens]|uniref:MAGUK p55 subfamily member 7 n=1 Tax=Odobenus rosmarus divergens TaxID=9708 RepID=A0A9B0M5S0_ODORO